MKEYPRITAVFQIAHLFRNIDASDLVRALQKRLVGIAPSTY